MKHEGGKKKKTLPLSLVVCKDSTGGLQSPLPSPSLGSHQPSAAPEKEGETAEVKRSGGSEHREGGRRGGGGGSFLSTILTLCSAGFQRFGSIKVE